MLSLWTGTDASDNDRFNYKSSDASTASQRPKLVIQYTTSSSTPTPGPSPTPTNTPSGPTQTPTWTPTPSQTPTVAPTTPSPTFQNATFVYDGDGKRVKSTFNGTTTTYFVGAHYEVTGSTVTKYYYAGAQRIAMRSNGTLSYLLGDHLGSTSLTTDAAGNIVSEIRYKAWGTVRYATENVPTRYQYTGQYSYEAEFGLYFYNARWYDPVLSRFAQADSIVPSGVQGWDRYAYVNNNPLAYTDPSGHKPAECEIKCVPRSVLDRSKLSPVGRDLYDTYIKLWNKSTGWWWGLYGADGDFTIDEFMAMNWHYEQANYGSLKGYNAAVRNAASSWQLASGCQNTSYTCDVSTAEGSLNFLGYYSEVAENRADACGNSPCNLNKQFNPTFWDKESGKRLVIAIYNAQPRNEFDDDEPFAVGNVSMNEAVYRKMLKRGWTGPFIGGKNPMFVLSYCQATFAWWAIAQGNSNHTSPLNYLTGSNYFCN